jgi:hypothetical protein
MERRSLLKIIAVVTGTAVVAGDTLLVGCKSKTDAGGAALKFSEGDVTLLNDIADTIIPDTPDSPGAKAAKVGQFMETQVADCYTTKQQAAFTKGIATFKEVCLKNNKKAFTELTAPEKIAFLKAMEQEAKTYNAERDKKDAVAYEAWQKENAKKPYAEQKELEGEPSHYYSMFKQLTLFGYFTSEIGQTKALNFLPVPGKFDGAYPYKKGDKAWAL